MTKTVIKHSKKVFFFYRQIKKSSLVLPCDVCLPSMAPKQLGKFHQLQNSSLIVLGFLLGWHWQKSYLLSSFANFSALPGLFLSYISLISIYRTQEMHMIRLLFLQVPIARKHGNILEIHIIDVNARLNCLPVYRLLKLPNECCLKNSIF